MRPRTRILPAQPVRFVLLFLMTLSLGIVPARVQAAAAARIDCDFSAGACKAGIGTGTVTLDIGPRPPRAMSDLTFRLTLAGYDAPPALRLHLRMPGMNMGPNAVTLARTSDGSYLGKGVIPRCPSGRRLWSAAVILPSGEEVSFYFHVR